MWKNTGGIMKNFNQWLAERWDRTSRETAEYKIEVFIDDSGKIINMNEGLDGIADLMLEPARSVIESSPGKMGHIVLVIEVHKYEDKGRFNPIKGLEQAPHSESKRLFAGVYFLDSRGKQTPLDKAFGNKLFTRYTDEIYEMDV
jgi:hypothetical protein